MSEEAVDQEMRVKERGWVHVSKAVAIFVVLTVGILGMKFLKENGPEADKEEPPEVVPVVRVVTARSGDEQMYIESQGKVEPGRRTQAASEVMGRVVMVSPKFKTGGVFARNEMMLEIDSADYVSALASAESALADAKLALKQELARAEQAMRDWRKLGRGEPSELVARKPQIASARARVEAAEAQVGKAMRDLDRTKLRAPYDCRVEMIYTDLGSYIVPGARLADLYTVDDFEVRVPVTLEEMGYLNGDSVVGSEVVVRARIAGAEREWTGKVIRSEGVVDRATMTVYLVVGLDENKGAGVYAFPQSGLFVQALIKGGVMEDVVSIPRSALRDNNNLLVINGDNLLEVIPVKVARTLRKTVLLSGGVKDGIRVIVSPMETPVPGMKLALEGGEKK